MVLVLIFDVLLSEVYHRGAHETVQDESMNQRSCSLIGKLFTGLDVFLFLLGLDFFCLYVFFLSFHCVSCVEGSEKP